MNIIDFLKIFYPVIELAPNTKLTGHYFGESSNFSMIANSGHLKYNGMTFDNLTMNQTMDSSNINVTFHASNFKYGDSLKFENINFKTTGAKNELLHNLSWEQANDSTSLISWETTVKAPDHYRMLLNPSYFFLNDFKWDIAHESIVHFDNDTISIDNFELTRADQYISIDGRISDNRGDNLNFIVRDFELGEIASLFGTKYSMKGQINSTGFVSNPFNSLGFKSNGNLLDFTVKGQKIGVINIRTSWNKAKQALQTRGELTYIDEKTFDFVGDYYLFKKEDNLDFQLNFDYTDLQRL